MTSVVYRVLSIVPICFVVAVVVFSLMQMAPGDPAAMMSDDFASEDQIAQVRRDLGLDQPVVVQFWLWLGRVLKGDFGTSLFSKIPVSTLIAQRLEPTISLAVGAMTVAIATAIPLGALAAVLSHSWVDRLVMTVAVLGFSLPSFVLGYGGVWLFSFKLDWLPVQGYAPIASGLEPWLKSILLPSLTLGLISAAFLARVTRATVLDVLAEDYVRTGHAKGLRPRTVVVLHVLKNAAIPIVTVIGTSIAGLLSGVVIVESVFAIPGIGSLVIDSVLKRDYPVIQGVILFLSIGYVVVNLSIDLSYRLFDPRIEG